MRRLALLGLLVTLAVPASAAAHATMIEATPGFRERLERSPRQIVLRFDQAVMFPSVRVLDSSGRDRTGAVRVDGLRVVAAVRPLAKGAYTVRWHALSADSHVVSGVWTFGVRVKAPPPTEAYGAAGPSRTEHLVRWAYFLALGVLVGSLAFRFLCLRGLALPPGLERRLAIVSGVAVVGVLEVGILAFCLRCQGVLQLPFGKFLYGDLSPISTDTRFGKAFVAMTLGYAAVAALLYLAWLLDRPRLLAPAFALSIVFASGLSLSGHDGAGGSWVAAAADWVHLSAASLWIGGLVALAVAVWPAAPELRREAFRRFSRVAVWLVVLVVAAGVYLSVIRLPRLSDLWTTGYGQVLLVKVGLVLAVLAWGAVHHFAVRPALDGAGESFLARVGRSVLGETALVAAVLLAAAVLVDSKPPPRMEPPGSVQPSSSESREAYAGAVGSASWRK